MAELPEVADFQLDFEITSDVEHASLRVRFDGTRWQIERSTNAASLITAFSTSPPDALRIGRAGDSVSLAYRIAGEDRFQSAETPYTFTDDWGRISVLASSEHDGEPPLRVESINAGQSESPCSASSFREDFAENQMRVSRFWETVAGGSDVCVFPQTDGSAVFECQHQEGEIYAALQSSVLDFQAPQDISISISEELTTPPLERSFAIEDVQSGAFIDVAQTSEGFFYFTNIDNSSNFLATQQGRTVTFRRTTEGVDILVTLVDDSELSLAQLVTTSTFSRMRLRLELDAADISAGTYETRFEGVNAP